MKSVRRGKWVWQRRDWGRGKEALTDSAAQKNPVQGVKSSLVLASATRFRDRGQKTEKLWWLVPCQGQAEGLPCRSLQRWFLLRFTRLMQTFFLFTFLKLMVKIGHSRKHLFSFFFSSSSWDVIFGSPNSQSFQRAAERQTAVRDPLWHCQSFLLYPHLWKPYLQRSSKS